MLVGVTGFMGSGKDTFADALIEQHGFVKYSMAGPLKQAVGILFGWSDHRMNDRVLKEEIDPYWGVSPRQILRWVGTEVCRELLPARFKALADLIGSNFWVKKALQFISQNPKSNIVIPDIRFQNEVDMILGQGGVAVKVRRESAIPAIIEHPSEDIDNLLGIRYIVTNEGSIYDLQVKAKGIMQWTN